MGDYTNRSRSILELIASLSGRSCGVPTSGGSGAPSITDQDVAGAVAMARQYRARIGKKDAPPLPTCARPELLLLFWGGRTDLVALVAKRCSDAITRKRDDPRMVRSASLLSAQALAGRTPDLEVSRWALDCSRVDLEREMGYALEWMRGELAEAERAYCRALRRWTEQIAA